MTAEMSAFGLGCRADPREILLASLGLPGEKMCSLLLNPLMATRRISPSKRCLIATPVMHDRAARSLRAMTRQMSSQTRSAAATSRDFVVKNRARLANTTVTQRYAAMGNRINPAGDFAE
jgi:hypothetical protein